MALCSALAEFFTWTTDDATAVAAVAGGWPFAEVIAPCKPDSAVFSAAVCDGNADLASAANVVALAWTLLNAACSEPRPLLATSTVPEVLDRGLELAGVGTVRRRAVHPAASPDTTRTTTAAGSSAHLRGLARGAGLMHPPGSVVFRPVS
jgi:hypothetical protein